MLNKLLLDTIQERGQMIPYGHGNMLPLLKYTPMFICLLINTGLNCKPTIASYWWTTESQCVKWFQRIFSRNRFLDILAYFHMVDSRNIPKPKEPNYDPCARVQPLIDHMNKVSKFYYAQNKFLSVDESIIPTKCHNPFDAVPA